MERAEQFFRWFLGIGGVIPKDKKEEIEAKFITIPVTHSFKERANEIKEKYNHKFPKFDDFLENTPDISRLKFDRKYENNT